MKLAIVNQPYDRVLPPRQNSIGLIAYNTALALAREAAVTLYARRHPSEDKSLELPFDVRYIDAPLDDTLHGLLGRYPRWSRRFGVEGMSDTHLDYARRVAADMDRSAPDVAHVMNYWSWARQLRGRGRRKIVLEMQCEWLSQKDPVKVARQLEAVDAVVGVSDHITSLFKESFPKYPGVVATAYNGVDVDVFKPAAAPVTNAQPSIVFVGRVSPEKGIHTLIDAFALVAQRFPQAQLQIIGAQISLPSALLVDLSSDPLVAALKRFYDGSLAPDYQSWLQARVRSLGLEQQVRFVGGLAHAELVSTYQHADLLVNPSLSESFGITVVEAMACGVPTVATKVGGMLETVVHGQTGLLVEPEQPEPLAQAMIDILADRERAASQGAAGRQRAEAQFSWAARGRRMAEVYRQLS
jgi:glycosyltransferase involved in cell wall biosynthesis